MDKDSTLLHLHRTAQLDTERCPNWPTLQLFCSLTQQCVLSLRQFSGSNLGKFYGHDSRPGTILVFELVTTGLILTKIDVFRPVLELILHWHLFHSRSRLRFTTVACVEIWPTLYAEQVPSSFHSLADNPRVFFTHSWSWPRGRTVSSDKWKH